MDGNSGCGGIAVIGVILLILGMALIGMMAVDSIEGSRASIAASQADQAWARADVERARVDAERVRLEQERESNIHREEMFQMWSITIAQTTSSNIGLLTILAGLLGAILGMLILRWLNRLEIL